MVPMIVLTHYLTYKLDKKKGFDWVYFIYVLCIMQNYVTLCMGFGDWLEQSQWHQPTPSPENHPNFVAAWISSFVGLFFFFTIVIYWLFGFKYWVIAIEVPRFINGELPPENQERKYKIYNASAVIFLAISCIVTAYFRDILSH